MSRATTPSWPATFAAIGPVLAVCLTAIVASPLLLLFGGGDDRRGFLDTAVLTLAQDASFVVVAVSLAWLSGGLSLRAFGLTRPRIRSSIAWAIGALTLYWLFAFGYGQMFQLPVDTTPQRLGADQDGAGPILFLLIVIAVAPVVEELFFRGFVFGALRNALGVAPAAIVAGAIFGLFHWDFATVERLQVVLLLAVFGAVLCWIYWATGSLVPAIAAHALNNAVASYSALESRDVSGSLAMVAITFLVSMVALIVATRRLPPIGVDRHRIPT